MSRAMHVRSRRYPLVDISARDRITAGNSSWPSKTGRLDVRSYECSRDRRNGVRYAPPVCFSRKCASCQIFVPGAAVRLSCVVRRAVISPEEFVCTTGAHIEADYHAYNPAYLLLLGRKGEREREGKKREITFPPKGLAFLLDISLSVRSTIKMYHRTQVKRGH